MVTSCSIHSGKGTPRRAVKRAPARSGADDKKLQQTLKKLNTQPIQAIEEVNMFKSDGNVIHFSAPKGTSACLGFQICPQHTYTSKNARFLPVTPR